MTIGKPYSQGTYEDRKCSQLTAKGIFRVSKKGKIFFKKKGGKACNTQYLFRKKGMENTLPSPYWCPHLADQMNASLNLELFSIY